MLNTFPQLLTYSFFAPTLLRIAVACVFFYLTYLQWQDREKIISTKFPQVLQGPIPLWISLVVNILIGLSLFFGYETQWGAIGAAIISVQAAFRPRYSVMFPLSRSTWILIFVISLALLITGAGAVAFDIPL